MRRAAPFLLSVIIALAVAPTRADDEHGALELVKRRKLSELLPGKRFEGSGVVFWKDAFWVVFDDRPDVARISLDLEKGEFLPGKSDHGYEGIAVDRKRERFYAIVEAAKHEGKYLGRVDEYSSSWEPAGKSWLLEVESKAKGYEGIEIVERGGETFVLALREPPEKGRGRIDVFKHAGQELAFVATFLLPEGLGFGDYSALDIRDGKVLVASQQARVLWIGELLPEKWEVKDKGRTIPFPAFEGKPWAHVEGVSWIDAERIVIVSDRPKKGDVGTNDETIAIFRLTK